MTATEPATTPDVRDMAIVHRLFRREFALAPLILRDLKPGEHERRAALGEWLDVVVTGVHHHHTTEDAIIFPTLEGRIPDDLIEVMAQQHEEVAAGTDAVEAALRDWRADRPGSLEVLAQACERVLPVLTRHLDDEERDIVPLIESHMTAQEYGRMATSGNNGRVEERTLLMSFGAMVEECSAEDAAHMISHLPPDLQRTWYGTARGEYVALMALLRGDVVPSGRPASTAG